MRQEHTGQTEHVARVLASRRQPVLDQVDSTRSFWFITQTAVS
jgi:hypothetical protein